MDDLGRATAVDCGPTHSKPTDSPALKNFRRVVEITKDERFQANLRLSRRQRYSSYVIALLSLYVISLSLIPNILDVPHRQAQILLACSIILSVFVVFTSIVEGTQNFYHRGELLHQCARKIAKVHHALNMIEPEITHENLKAELDKLYHEYQKALDECPVNHDNVDYYRIRKTKPHLFPSYYTGKSRPDFFLRHWTGLVVIVLEFSWAILHLVAFIGITIIVVVCVLAPNFHEIQSLLITVGFG